ncbi:MAG: calcium/sodium antiporter [Acidimicrobiia bacterium]|nr:calcium/sodium antiporter [Acidimicrobiia bacterium]
MALDIIRVVAGLVLLIVAADRLVIAAVRIAKVLDVSAVIIGAVIVGFGTSVPEFVVSAIAASHGNIELGIANVVASNIANVTLVLGVAAVISVLSTRRTVIKREGALMFVAVAALGVILLTGSITRPEGIALSIGMVVALFVLVRWAKADPDDATPDLDDIEADETRLGVEVVYGIAAIAATVVAGQVLLTGVENIGSRVGLSVVFMGLITGVGTSLPELSASIAGARRGQSDIVLGNVLGSNTFNSLGVAGAAAIIGPGSTSSLGIPFIALMMVAAVVAGAFALSGQRMTRWEGVVLLGVFVGYAVVSS